VKVASLALLVWVLAAAAAAEDVKSVTKATYAGIDRAFEKRDIKAVEAVFGPRVTTDFRAIVGGHGVTYQQLLDNFRGMFYAFPKIAKSKTAVQSLKTNGKTATLRVFSSLTAYAQSKDRKNHHIELTNTSEDVWKLVGGKWKMATSTTLSESRMLDGKPIPTH